MIPARWLSRRDVLAASAALVTLPLRGRPPDERARLLGAVGDKDDLALLQRMLRMRSYSAGGEEGPLARLLVQEMTALGLDARLQEVEPGRFNAIGVLRGSGAGKSLMLNGHIDTNPVGVGWTVDPFAGLVKDDFIYGIGVSNMKASCAAFFGAARAIVRSGVRPKGDLVLTFVVGELQGGVGTQKVVSDGVRTDAFIVGEPTDLALLTLHAAGLEVQINALGVTRHMSKLEESVSAIDVMYKVIDRIRRMTFTGPANPEYASVRRVNVGSMRAGLGREYHDWRTPQVPDFASMKVAIRYGPGQSEASILADLQRELDALAREDPRLVTEIVEPASGGAQRARPFEVPRDAPIVQIVADQYASVVGSPPPIGAIAPYRYYGTDAPFLAQAGATGVVCGVGGKYNTMPDERVEIRAFHNATRIFALSTLAFCV